MASGCTRRNALRSFVVGMGGLVLFGGDCGISVFDAQTTARRLYPDAEPEVELKRAMETRSFLERYKIWAKDRVVNEESPINERELARVNAVLLRQERVLADRAKLIAETSKLRSVLQIVGGSVSAFIALAGAITYALVATEYDRSHLNQDPM